jgi:hypothetical protein
MAKKTEMHAADIDRNSVNPPETVAILHPEIAADLRDVLGQLTHQGPGKTGFHSIHGGQARELMPDDAPDRISVASYNLSARSAHAENVRSLFEHYDFTLPADVEPIGHVAFDSTHGEVSFSGALYLLDNGAVVGLSAYEAPSTSALMSHDGRACSDFADSMGMGKAWTDIVYDAYDPTSGAAARGQVPIEYDDWMAEKLLDQLEGITEAG